MPDAEVSSSSGFQPNGPMVIAVHLPQFHPIEENDRWWGKGFTEWTNVAKARPLFQGHRQPHLPTDLGFYDLRVAETRQLQAAMAAQAGIGGFCYYHYWFNGHRLLHRPVDEILESGQPSFPFCLCWANENWTRSWDGRQRDVLMSQVYSAEDDVRHIEHLCQFFADPRYIRVGGKPLFIVYKINELPEPARTVERWRKRAMELGIGELCLAQFEANGGNSAPDPRSVGLDFTIEFAPDWRNMGGARKLSRLERLGAKLGLASRAYADHRIHDYQFLVDRALVKKAPDWGFVRCVSPGFDNSPRRPLKDSVVFHNSTPAQYEHWLNEMLTWARDRPVADRPIVFVNAWNEWGEGNHLEPDQWHGRAYLEATSRAVAKAGALMVGQSQA